jgi:hypothetical protein
MSPTFGSWATWVFLVKKTLTISHKSYLATFSPPPPPPVVGCFCLNTPKEVRKAVLFGSLLCCRWNNEPVTRLPSPPPPPGGNPCSNSVCTAPGQTHLDSGKMGNKTVKGTVSSDLCAMFDPQTFVQYVIGLESRH